MFYGCGNDSKKDSFVRPVKVGNVFKAIEEPIDILSGTVVAGDEAKPSFAVPGLLTNIYVKEGAFVKAGTLIAEIDAADYKAAAEAATSKYQQVNAEVARVEELFKRNSVTKNEYEKAIAGRQSVSSIYQTAINQLKSTKLYAPISGIVQSIDAVKYQTIMPGIGVLTIINTENLLVETNIPSALFVKQNKFKSFLGHSIFTKDSIPMKIRYISPKANNNQLYRAVLDIDAKYLKNLAPGMTIEIKLTHKASGKQEISVPLQSVFYDNSQEFVWIADLENLTVKKRRITTGSLNKDGKIVVEEGLNGDEKIIIAGVHKLREGQKIRILD
jgi:RND family efflux transporter MFP subunit